MARVLITGMSGTGKSTVLGELAQRGHRVVDMDDPGRSVEVATPDGAGLEQLWRVEPLTALLAEDHEAGLFVAGCASNQGSFYDRFEAVVLLSAPREVLLRRLASREGKTFGRTPAERERVLADLTAVEPLLRAGATAEIDTTQALGSVVDAVLAVAGPT